MSGEYLPIKVFLKSTGIQGSGKWKNKVKFQITYDFGTISPQDQGTIGTWTYHVEKDEIVEFRFSWDTTGITAGPGTITASTLGL